MICQSFEHDSSLTISDEGLKTGDIPELLGQADLQIAAQSNNTAYKGNISVTLVLGVIQEYGIHSR